MQWPASFRQTIHEVHGDKGDTWLLQLPAIIDSCRQRWGLLVGDPFLQLSYNLVLQVEDREGQRLALKLGVPTDELQSEAAALAAYGGQGAVRLVASDASLGAMVLERIEPGESLHTCTNPAMAIERYGQVHLGLRRADPNDARIPVAAQWGTGFARLRQHFAGQSGPLPADLVDAAESTFQALVQSTVAPELLHGDLHHGNILRAGNHWTAIDPKGLIGDPAYDTISFFLNLPDEQTATTARLQEAVRAVCSVLSYDPVRVQAWGFAHCMLSAWWSLEDHGHGFEPALELARRFAAAL